MWIGVVDPQKERFRQAPIKEVDHLGVDLTRVLPPVVLECIEVGVETAPETETTLEHSETDDTGRVPPLVPEDLGHHGKPGSQDLAVVVDAVLGRDQRGEERRVARPGDRDVRVRMAEGHAPRRQAVDVGRRQLRTVNTQPIRAQGVHHDQENVAELLARQFFSVKPRCRHHELPVGRSPAGASPPVTANPISNRPSPASTRRTWGRPSTRSRSAASNSTGSAPARCDHTTTLALSGGRPPSTSRPNDRLVSPVRLNAKTRPVPGANTRASSRTAGAGRPSSSAPAGRASLRYRRSRTPPPGYGRHWTRSRWVAGFLHPGEVERHAVDAGEQHSTRHPQRVVVRPGREPRGTYPAVVDEDRDALISSSVPSERPGSEMKSGRTGVENQEIDFGSLRHRPHNTSSRRSSTLAPPARHEIVTRLDCAEIDNGRFSEDPGRRPPLHEIVDNRLLPGDLRGFSPPHRHRNPTPHQDSRAPSRPRAPATANLNRRRSRTAVYRLLFRDDGLQKAASSRRSIHVANGLELPFLELPFLFSGLPGFMTTERQLRGRLDEGVAPHQLIHSVLITVDNLG